MKWPTFRRKSFGGGFQGLLSDPSDRNFELPPAEAAAPGGGAAAAAAASKKKKGKAPAPAKAPAPKANKGKASSAALAAPPSSDAWASPSGLPDASTPINRAKDRTDAIDKPRQVQVGGIKMTYAYISLRGFYPDDPFKENQDAYAVRQGVSKQRDDLLFAVFDGHGKDGDGCAQYARKHLPQQLGHHLDRAKPRRGGNSKDLAKEQVQQALHRAHVDTNKGLHKHPSVDDTLSGTTAISIYFHGGSRNRITIANVGDSRAILGQAVPAGGTGGGPGGGRRESARALKALALSRDQTPYRKDEKARVKRAGARVLSLDQLEGLEPIVEGGSENEESLELGEELDEGGDPPRIWAQNGDYPGTAFTRSIGDSVAEELGVFAEPEMLTREVLPEDKILIVASDGVYEFLTNQSVIDICAKFSDPLEACRAVVAEAYELWLQYELRTDDITIICIFVDEVKGGSRLLDDESEGFTAIPTPVRGAALSDDDVDSTLVAEDARPVRKHVSKKTSKALEKMREQGNKMEMYEGDENFDWRKHATKKTPEEKASIAEAIKASVMFRNTSDEQKEMIFACMESVHVKAGTWVIRQGSVGDRFYICDEGQFEVRILPDGQEDPTGHGGHIVHVYDGSRARNSHPSFGELALVHSMPRSASVVAKTDGHLWALHRAAFRQVLVEAQDHRKELKKVLGEIPYFQYLDSDAINKLATIMDEVTFGRGETIAEQGRRGECMHVIASGSCTGVRKSSGGDLKKVSLRAGSYFGDEIFAMEHGKYAMTVVTMQTTVCWQLDHEVMKQTMGPLLKPPP